MATTLSQEWLPNLRFIAKYSENQPFSAIFALPRVANVRLYDRVRMVGQSPKTPYFISFRVLFAVFVVLSDY